MLGLANGPGFPIWQPPGGSNPAKMATFTLYTNVNDPDPSTMALTGQGVAAVLTFRRRK